MGSMGFFLCDWSVEFLKYRSEKKKAKKQRLEEEERRRNQEDAAIQAQLECGNCIDKDEMVTSLSDKLDQYQKENKRFSEIFGNEADNSNMENILQTAQAKNTELQKLKEDYLKLSESVAVQLRERDKAHSERVRSLEIIMSEKEKQLLASSNSIRQQLANAKLESETLHKQLDKYQSYQTNKQNIKNCNLEQELDSLMVVLDMKREENDKLKADNNSLKIDIERLNILDVQLQVEKQKVEEMSGVILMKNEQLRQVLDEYDNVQHQLDIEVAAHTSCQQELEKIQFDKENFLIENNKRWKELENQKKSGLILDVIRKEKAVAYSFNC